MQLHRQQFFLLIRRCLSGAVFIKIAGKLHFFFTVNNSRNFLRSLIAVFHQGAIGQASAAMSFYSMAGGGVGHQGSALGNAQYPLHQLVVVGV